MHRSSKEGSGRSTAVSYLRVQFTGFLVLSASSKMMNLAAWVITALLCICTKTTMSVSSVKWEFRGPTTYYTRDDSLRITSAGAVQDVASGNGTWFIGSVNGGIWRTSNLQSKVPHWENVLDSQVISVATLSLLSMSLVLIQQEFTLGVVVLRAANKDMIGTS